MRFLVTSSIFFVVSWFNAAAAQEGYLGHDHDKWHRNFYQMLQRPDTKTPCCNPTDCRPTSGKRVDDHYEVKVNGAWVSVPLSKILKQSAPDLGFHVCAPFKFDGQPDHLYCVVVPPETTTVRTRANVRVIGRSYFISRRRSPLSGSSIALLTPIPSTPRCSKATQRPAS